MSAASTRYSERIPSGEAIAAFMAATIGLMALALANLALQANDAFFGPLWRSVGAWLPNAQSLGPYAGAETVLLVSWLGAWVILHRALRGRHVRVKVWTLVMVAGVACAALLCWPPFVAFLLDLFSPD